MLSRLVPRRGLWQHPDFLKLWSGQLVSSLGTGITQLAIPTIAVLTLHASAFAVGLLIAAERLPFPILALIAGGLVDRVRKRRLMIAADGARMLLLAFIPAAAFAGVLSLWQLYVVAFLVGTLTVFFDLAYLAYLPVLVTRRNLVEANAKMSAATAVEDIAGAGFGGLLIQFLGAARAVTVDSATYLVSVFSLLLMRAPEAVPERAHRQALWREIGEGVRVVWTHRVLRSQVLTFVVMIVGGHAVEAAEYPFAYRSLHLTPGGLGLAIALAGVGGVAGLASAARLLAWLGIGRAVTLGNSIVALALGGMLIGLRLPPLPTLCVLFFLLGLCDTVSNIGQVSVRQALTPDRLQGRMSAVFRTAYWGAWPLGNLLGGIAGNQFGLVPTILAGAGVGLAGSLAMALTPFGRVRELPGGDANPAP